MPWGGTYGATKSYRTRGAIEASKFGAVASLTRSITPFSLYTPHTGAVYYEDGIIPIPAAAITVEDSELLFSIQNAGDTITLNLFLSCETLAPAQSRNGIYNTPNCTDYFLRSLV